MEDVPRGDGARAVRRMGCRRTARDAGGKVWTRVGARVGIRFLSALIKLWGRA